MKLRFTFLIEVMLVSLKTTRNADYSGIGNISKILGEKIVKK